jgi:hypothetical protein
MNDRRVPSAPVKPPVGNLGSGVTAIFQRLGVAEADTQHDVHAAVDAAMAERGHHATVRSWRYGELVVETTSSSAKMLDWDRDQVLAAIDSRAPGSVSSMRIIVSRARR